MTISFGVKLLGRDLIEELCEVLYISIWVILKFLIIAVKSESHENVTIRSKVILFQK